MSFQVDLFSFIAMDGVNILNNDPVTVAAHVLKETDDEKYVRTDPDMDSELIITVPFKTAVRLSSLVIKADLGPDGECCDSIFWFASRCLCVPSGSPAFRTLSNHI